MVMSVSRSIVAHQVTQASQRQAADVLRFGDFELDTALFEVRRSGTRIAVEPQVFNILVYLARNSARTVTKDEIFREIWEGRIVSDAALSSQIKAARKALGDNGASQHMIRTVHGRGFRFVASVEEAPAPRPAANQDADNRHAAARAPAAGGRPSVAVLPLANSNRDPDEDYIADGITEDIITALSKHRCLMVVARNPAFACRDSSDSIGTIGRKLGADYIVIGSVRKAETRIRITVQVFDAETERSVWSERFDRDVVDIFDLQDEIAGLVAARIGPELDLTEQRKAEKRPRKNLGAWDLFQLGVSEFYRFTRESNRTSQELIRRALEMDRDLARAHAQLAHAIVLGMVYFDDPPERERLDEALAAAKRAIELDDQDANGYYTLGRVHLARCEYDQAIGALEHALELNPCLAQAYCGLGDSLAYEGRLEEAIAQLDIAIRLSPHDPFRWGFYSYRSLAHLFRGDFAEAVLWARKAIRVPNAQYWAKAHLVAALGHVGDAGQAKAAIGDLLQAKPEFSLAFARRRLFYLKRPDQMDLYLTGLSKAGLT